MSFSKNYLIAGISALLTSACAPAGPLPEVTPPPQETARADDISVPGKDLPEEEPRAPRRTAPVIVGAIITQSGDPFLERFGSQVLDGIKLAVEAYNLETYAPVELVVLDDEGDPQIAASLVRGLEERGAVAIIGPLRPEGVAAAAMARGDGSLLLLSPTAPDLPARPNIFTLNTVDSRGAAVMAEYALSAGLRRVGLIYPESPEYRRQAEVFREILGRGGGTIVAEGSYPPGTNTFAAQIQAVAGVLPEAVFIPTSERDARQIAPQIIYYGLADTGAQILGTEGWSGEDLLHEVPARYLEGVIATTTLYRPSPDFGWNDFVALYEETYRRSIDTALPALGFDAASLVLRALGDGRTTAAEIAERFSKGDEIRGATGWISIQNGEVGRRPIVVRIEEGAIVPLTGAAPSARDH